MKFINAKVFSLSEAKIEIKQYLCFDSNFECANLGKVIAISPTEYELFLNSDTNSPNRTQWFYFLVSNTRKSTTVKFTIMNQTKSPCFYKEGMTPLVFSEKDNSAMYVTWASRTSDMILSKTQTQPTRSVGNRYISVSKKEEIISDADDYAEIPDSYNILSFTHTFKFDDDRVYFAFAKPYGYRQLVKYLDELESGLGEPKKILEEQSTINKLIETEKLYYKRELLCMSLGGIPVDCITLTSPQNNGLEKSKCIIITSRVHASETPGSYKIEGILNFLTSRDNVAKSLLREFIFLIVPMLNPDGVVLGNNRCSLHGYDLNRCWAHPTVNKHPTIFALKKKMQDLVSNQQKEIYVFSDLHGHSKQLNAFIYACHKVSGAFCPWSKVRLLPRILARKTHLLDYHKCRFKVEQEKLSTARVIVWKEFKVVNSFTLESSMYGYSVGEEVVRYFLKKVKLL